MGIRNQTSASSLDQLVCPGDLNNYAAPDCDTSDSDLLYVIRVSFQFCLSSTYHFYPTFPQCNAYRIIVSDWLPDVCHMFTVPISKKEARFRLGMVKL